jgi:hypothetical protein
LTGAQLALFRQSKSLFRLVLRVFCMAPFSAEVSLSLVIAGRVLRCAKSGPGYAHLAEPQAIAAGTLADLVMTVDGRESVWRVNLWRGATADDTRVFFRTISRPNIADFTAKVPRAETGNSGQNS